MSNGRRFRRSIRPATDRRLVVSRDIPDSASHREKEGAARRLLVAMTGKCPCGATLQVPDKLKVGAVVIVAVEHEDDCPAVEAN
jgi:hypothetical protein